MPILCVSENPNRLRLFSSNRTASRPIKCNFVYTTSVHQYFRRRFSLKNRMVSNNSKSKVFFKKKMDLALRILTGL